MGALSSVHFDGSNVGDGLVTSFNGSIEYRDISFGFTVQSNLGLCRERFRCRSNVKCSNINENVLSLKMEVFLFGRLVESECSIYHN